MKKLPLIALLIAACGTVNVAQPLTLSLAFKAGETYKYKFHSTTTQKITMGSTTVNTSFEMTADETVTVKSVDSSGTADLTLTMRNVTLKTVTGGVTNTTTMADGQTSDVKIASDGRPVSVDGSTISNSNPFLAISAMGGSYFIAAVLPDHPVRPGDQWTKSYDQANPEPMTGSIHITSTSNRKNDESVKGVNAAVVETQGAGNLNLSFDMSKVVSGTGSTFPGASVGGMTLNGTLTAHVKTWIDPGGRRVMQTHSSSHDEATMNFQASAGAQTIPGLTGPISVKGDSTTDLTPA